MKICTVSLSIKITPKTIRCSWEAHDRHKRAEAKIQIFHLTLTPDTDKGRRTVGRIIVYLLFLFSFFLPSGLEMNLYKLNICESTVYTHIR